MSDSTSNKQQDNEQYLRQLYNQKFNQNASTNSQSMPQNTQNIPSNTQQSTPPNYSQNIPPNNIQNIGANNNKPKPKKPLYLQGWFLTIVGIGILAIILIRAGRKNESTPKPEETPVETVETTSETPEPETDTAEPEEEWDTSIDAEQWPEVAALNMPNDQMFNLFKDYNDKIYSEEYPEDDVDAIDAYEEKVKNEIAEKYNITPEQARLVYGYVWDNYAKVAGNGKPISKTPELSFGELKEDILFVGDCAIVSVKINPNLTNEMTIQENYMIVEDLIKNKGYDVFNTIKYIAFGNSTDGDEMKIISFDVPKSTIDAYVQGKILDTEFGDYVEGLWIHHSLQE